MKTLLILSLIWVSDALASDFKTRDEIAKEFKEPGHEKHILVEYPKLESIIPKQKLEALKAQKKKRKDKKKEAKQNQKSDVNFISSAFAAGKKNVPPETPPLIVTPNEVDLRLYDTPIRSQWDGTCTAHGLIASIENLIRQSKRDHDMLSARYLWSQYKKYDVYAAINAATKNKQAYDKYWPQNSKNPKTRDIETLAHVQMKQTDYLDDDIEAAIEALKDHLPVYIGFAVPLDMANCRSTIRMNTKMTDGGHAVAVVGFVIDKKLEGGGYFILKNSWGSDCGDNGYQYMPFDLCERDDMYCVMWSINKVNF